MSEIRTVIRRLTIEKRWTQRQVAYHLGISEQYWGDVLHCRRDFSIPLAIRLEELFGLSAESILVEQVLRRLSDARTRAPSHENQGSEV